MLSMKRRLPLVVLLLGLFVLGASGLHAQMKVNPEATGGKKKKEGTVIQVEANEEALDLTAEELELERDKTYDVAIRYLKPHTRIKVEFFKAGVSMGHRSFRTNHNGEFMFEYTTPKKRAKGKAAITYVPKNGEKTVRKIQVKLR